MELDRRQGDLFLDVLQGGKPDPVENYRKKFDELVYKTGTIDKGGLTELLEEKPLPNTG